MKKVTLRPVLSQGALFSVVAVLDGAGYFEDAHQYGGGGVSLWFGSRGGGYVSPPKWVPARIRDQFKKAWDAADLADLEKRYGPDDDGLQRSEVDFGDSKGFFAIAPSKVDDVAGIDHFTTDPISFTHQGKKWVIWGGVSGV